MVPCISYGQADPLMPGYSMAISVGICASMKEEWQRTLVLDEKDAVIPLQDMKPAEEIFRHGGEHVHPA
jgi:hypothetical protein